LEIWQLAKPYYEKGRAYDAAHIEWMMAQADRLADMEHLDKTLLLPIVILHDVGYSSILTDNNPDIKDKAPKIAHMATGAKIAADILDQVGYSSPQKERIVHYISVHDNWILDDDTPFQECREMAAFNDLDFLYTLSDHNSFVLMGQSMKKTPSETYNYWLQDEKLTRRPFCCAETKRMFADFMNTRKSDIATRNY